jgi:16S rRNA (cytidine1402-2'-O)-methyltransferase
LARGAQAASTASDARAQIAAVLEAPLALAPAAAQTACMRPAPPVDPDEDPEDRPADDGSGHAAGRLPPGLYIVAGPIGNLEDISFRAARILREVDLVACEDTRVTAKLLRAAGSERPMLPYHDHSAPHVTSRLIERMARESVALVSDAGTPLISDPGYGLVREARARGVPVTSAPGPSAAIMALSISGLPTDRFLFAGFLPAKAAARDKAIAGVAGVPATLVFYETGPRLAATLAAMAQALGPREAVVARELTKRHEEVLTGTLPMLAERLAGTEPRGEIVLVVGPPAEEVTGAEALDQALLTALKTMAPGKAAASVAAALGVPRGDAYARAMELKDRP